MSLDPEELAIREAFDRRRPAAVPAELLARVAAVPGEIKPLRPMPVRLVLGVAPWIAVAAAGLVLAFGPRLGASLVGLGVGADAGATWTPANPGGGFANEGIFGLPWAPMLPILAVVVALWTVWRVHSGGRLVPARADLWRALTWQPRTVRQILVYAIPVLGLLALVMAVETTDPIASGSHAAPGPEIGELRSDGAWWDDQGQGEWQRTDGPHYIFAMRSGTSFSTVVSIRNVSPVTITVLGLERGEGLTTADLLQGVDAVENGLGLLVDPQQIGSEPGNVSHFRPFTLDPGVEASLVIAWTAGSCADPVGGAERDPGSGRRAIDLVYDVLGWRRTSLIWLPFELTVPTRPGCFP